MKLLREQPDNRLFLTDDGILVSDRLADTEITAAIMEDFAKLIDDLGAPRRLLIRRLAASYAFTPDGYLAALEVVAPRLTAIAVVTHGGPHEMTIHREAALFPGLPGRGFVDEAEALAWLRGLTPER